MTTQQKINKIDQLEFWLKANPTHPDYSTALCDKLNLEKELKGELTENNVVNE